MRVLEQRAVLRGGPTEGMMDYPTRPKRPAVLSRVVSTLSSDEIATIPNALAEYQSAVDQYKTDMAAYNAQQAKKVAELRERCESEWEMKGHPKADLLWSHAWDRGHSSGLQEVYNAYQELVDLAR